MKSTKIRNALAALNAFAAEELGQVQTRRRPKPQPEHQDPPKIAAIKRYRREHPGATLREAAIACGVKVT